MRACRCAFLGNSAIVGVYLAIAYYDQEHKGRRNAAQALLTADQLRGSTRRDLESFLKDLGAGHGKRARRQFRDPLSGQKG